jgi:hypothetical protein
MFCSGRTAGVLRSNGESGRLDGPGSGKHRSWFELVEPALQSSIGHAVDFRPRAKHGRTKSHNASFGGSSWPESAGETVIKLPDQLSDQH